MPSLKLERSKQRGSLASHCRFANKEGIAERAPKQPTSSQFDLNPELDASLQSILFSHYLPSSSFSSFSLCPVPLVTFGKARVIACSPEEQNLPIGDRGNAVP